MSKARVDRLSLAVEQRRAARDAMPDTSGYGEMTGRDLWTKTFRRVDGDGQPIGTLVMRGGASLQITGVCLSCITGTSECCASTQPVPESQPVERPQEAAVTSVRPLPVPAVTEAVEDAQTATNGQPDPNLTAIARDRWHKDMGGRGMSV